MTTGRDLVYYTVFGIYQDIKYLNYVNLLLRSYASELIRPWFNVF